MRHCKTSLWHWTDVLLETRQRTGLTQAEVAGRMGIKQSALARIESSLGSRKHAPSLATLRKYAAVLGCKLEIRITPEKTDHARLRT
jgi:Predicted transcriptional regulators